MTFRVIVTETIYGCELEIVEASTLREARAIERRLGRKYKGARYSDLGQRGEAAIEIQSPRAA